MRSDVRIAFFSRLHCFSKCMQMQKRDLHLVVLSVKERELGVPLFCLYVDRHTEKRFVFPLGLQGDKSPKSRGYITKDRVTASEPAVCGEARSTLVRKSSSSLTT
jgi:hypothetical protein